MKKYKASILVNPEIREIEVDRETDSTIWESGKKYSERKKSSYYLICDTREEAKSFCENHYRDAIRILEKQVAKQIEYLNKALAL